MRRHRNGMILTHLFGEVGSSIIWAVFLFFQGGLASASGQSLALPSWDVLADESTVVVLGDVVEGQAWVIDPGKKAKAEVTPDRKPTLPNPGEFVLGTLARVQVKEVLKSDGKLKPRDIVSVFVYAYGGSDSPHVLIKNEKCIVFLHRMVVPNKEFAHATIVPPGTLGSPEKHSKFDPERCYVPVREGFAQVILTANKMQLLDEIKRTIAKRP